MKRSKLLFSLSMCGIAVCMASGAFAAPRWSVEKAREWGDANPWWCGVNYIPANAINYTAMWDKTSFSPEVIRRELALMTDMGMNCVRFVMQYKVYEDDPEYFLRTLDRFLALCDEAKVKAMPIFFDDCAFGTNRDPVIGRQPEPLEGWYAWAWSPSPGHTMVVDEREHPKLEKYVKDVIGRFKDDKRIFLWDLYNEPANGGLGFRSFPLLRKTFKWAREVDPVQPISSGIWNGDRTLNAILLDNSDIVTFHIYDNPNKTAARIRDMKAHGRPVICTEWMNRTRGSTVKGCLKVFADAGAGCMLWGLVNGKTQTHLCWGHRPEKLPYKGPWQHDLFRGDFTPYDAEEISLIKSACAANRQKPQAKLPEVFARSADTCAADRAFWIDSMIRIVAPVVTNLEAGTLRANLPRRRGHGIAQFSELEAFGRVMTGFAPWFELPDDDTPEGRLRAAWRPRLMKAIRNAVDPKSPDFLIFVAKNPKRERQPLVDAAFFAQGLLRSRKGVWDRLDETTKKMTIDALVSSRATNPHDSNWLLFAGEIEAFLLEVTGKCDEERLRLGVDKFAHKWYVGEGYYSDGPAMAFDGYNSFVIHPMFYEIAEVMARHGIKDGDKYLALEKKRLFRYADLQERMISPEGAYPMLGRSICYRFGALQGLGLAATLGRKFHPASDGAIRSAMTAVLRRQMADRNFRPDGWLAVGFNGEQHCLAEGYIGYGSVYLCTAFFLPLTLPPDSAFWTAPEEPWTSKAGWSGEKVRRDHMFR